MPGKNTSINLGQPFIDFARKKVESGEFATTSEVVREAMRQYMAEDAKVQALRREIQIGLDSGPPKPFDLEDFLREMRASYKGAA